MGTGRIRAKVKRATSGYDVRLPSPVTVDPEQLALFKAELLAHLRPSEDLGPTLGEFWPRFIAEHARAERQKPRGIDSKESIYRNHLMRFSARRLGSLGLTDVAELKASLSTRATKTVNNVLTVLAKTLSVAVEWKVLPRLPVEIRLLKCDPPTPKFYEFEQYAYLVECAAAQDYRKWAMLLLGGDAGLRLSEIVGLRWEDGVDFRRGENGQLHVLRGVSRGKESTPKSGKTRWVPMSSRLAAALQGVWADSGLLKPFGPVLRRDNGERLTDKVVHNWMAQVQRAAELDDRGDIHILRHTFCSHLAMRGVAARTIQELAGHASIRTTERYMHLAPSEMGRAIAMLNVRAGDGLPAAQNETYGGGGNRTRALNADPVESEVTRSRRKSRRVNSNPLPSVDSLEAWRDLLDEVGQ